MTTILTTERWTFAGVDLNSYAAMVRELTGGDTLPDLRGDNIVIPSRVGRYPVAKLSDQRRIALVLWISHLTAAGAEGPTPPAARQARTNLDGLLAVLARRATGPLGRVMPDGTIRTATAECVSVDVPEYPASRDGFPLVADFMLADPWFYGADVIVGPTTIAASPTDQVVTHPGTVATGRVLLDLVGPLANPRVTNQANGFYIECLVTVAAGKHLLLDCWAATATNDGALAIGSLRHSGGADLFRIEPGANTLRVTSGATGGSLTTTLHPPYA